ncbi:right-handed parallel beta-helix repeat-containing protein [Ramlibacter algicola]|uniref:Right-handed parallel beta-helix repeat-containing protein n=1 Tax=Ramlibacter algicola TaxID=2795217 RepID=A0A934PYF4_9BURK|nr:right-handed parallel beta-helix repeat-containing protein [Ramlibacter algicola]MBK0391678.1 right-handed parallel beta-helix repeat-containing protein [Ramlibacter algicola]
MATIAVGGQASDGPEAPWPVAQAVRLVEEGAACDGVTDDGPALARALARAKELRVPVLVPERRCAYADVIRVDGTTLAGSGPASVLHALDWRRSAIFMSGHAPRVSNLRLAGAAAPSRQSAWEMTRITLFGANDFVIDHVTIEGAAAAGIQTARGTRRGRITGNVVRNTLSDGIHLTAGASEILVEDNLVEFSGDDGIAVVSYRADPVPVSHITARGNVVRHNRWGRNMSVVGGEHVLYEDNLLQDNEAGRACLYIAQEGGDLPTRAARDVQARRNTLDNCGGLLSGHGAIMVFSDGQEPNRAITLRDNDVRGPRLAGIRVRGPAVDLVLEANRVSGGWRAVDVRDPAVRVVPYAGGPVGRSPRP